MSRKKRKKHRAHGRDKHHLLFYRAEWNKGYALLLRRVFVYEIPIPVHQDLHTVAGNVPVLNDADARWLWQEYKKLDHELDLFEALEWLQLNAPNLEFAAAIAVQREFLQQNLGGD